MSTQSSDIILSNLRARGQKNDNEPVCFTLARHFTFPAGPQPTPKVGTATPRCSISSFYREELLYMFELVGLMPAGV